MENVIVKAVSNQGVGVLKVPIYLFEAISSLKHLHVARESVAYYASLLANPLRSA